MQCKQDDVYKKSYPDRSNTLKTILGGLLIAAGVLILILCIPGWAWFSLIGISLIVIGVFHL